MKVIEAQHRPSNPFYSPVILFNDIVEILALTDFYSPIILIVELINAGFIGGGHEKASVFLVLD